MQSPLIQTKSSDATGLDARTADALGVQLRAALPQLRNAAVSLHDLEASVLWLSEGALGPDEHNVVLDAIETLRADRSLAYHELGLEDGRAAMFLAVRAPQGELVGLAMILTDSKTLLETVEERLLTPRLRTVLQKIAIFLRLGPTGSVPPKPEPRGAAPAPLSPAAMDSLLTLGPDEPTMPAVPVPPRRYP